MIKVWLVLCEEERNITGYGVGETKEAAYRWLAQWCKHMWQDKPELEGVEIPKTSDYDVVNAYFDKLDKFEHFIMREVPLVQ